MADGQCRLTRRAAALAVAGPLVAYWAGRLVRLRRSVGEHEQFWSRPRDRTGGLLYAALGDSAAQGIGASRPDRGYVGLLARRLEDATGRPIEVMNLSRSGARMADVLDAQLPTLSALGRRPDVVTVAIGGNDIVAYDGAVFAEQADRLADSLPAGAYVADAPYFMHGRFERDSRQAADLLAAAAVRRGLRAVALHDAQQVRGWRAMATDFAADWFHPNDRGHRVWADAFWHQMGPRAALLVVPDGERPAAVPADDNALPFDGNVQRRAAVAVVEGDGLRRAAGAARLTPRPS
jgi:lysophospholipase L1-like esterase